MKVTLSDIANATGFSVNTVSHALSGKSDISEKTRAVICEAAQKLGYIGNYAASCMRTGKSMTVALIIPDLKNPYFSVVLREIEPVLFSAGYTVTVFNTNEDANLERDAITACIGRNVDGIIICPTQKSIENIAFLRQSTTPYILLGRHFDSVCDPFVGHDDAKGGYLAAHHLISLGHRKIAFFNADQRISCSNDRLEGYKAALSEAKIDYDPQYVIRLSTTARQDDLYIIDNFFTEHPECTAVVAFNDIIAFQTIYFLERRGFHVPQDISVVGFDNVSSDFTLPFPLTSISVSKKEMATVSAKMLLSALRAKRRPEPQSIVLSCQILVRDSTAKPRKQ